MKYLKTYEGLFDFIKRKYKQVVEEPEEKVDYNDLVNISLKRLESNYSKYKVSNVVVKDSICEFDVEQVIEGLVAKLRLELNNNNWVLEINYPNFDIRKTINFPNRHPSNIKPYYKIHEIIESCKSDIFKKEFPLEDIKDYFSDLSDLIEGETKYQFEMDEVLTFQSIFLVKWLVKLYVDKTFPRGTRRDMEKLIKSQSLDLEVLKELKNLNLRLSNLGLVAVFEKEQIWDGQSQWNGYLVNVMRKSDLGVYSREMALNSLDDEDDDDYEEEEYDDEIVDEDDYEEDYDDYEED